MQHLYQLPVVIEHFSLCEGKVGATKAGQNIPVIYYHKNSWSFLSATPLCHPLLQLNRLNRSFRLTKFCCCHSVSVTLTRELKMINEDRKTLQNGEFYLLPTLFFEVKMFKLKNTRSTWCVINLRSASLILSTSIPNCLLQCWTVQLDAELSGTFSMQSEVLSRIERPLLFPWSLGY